MRIDILERKDEILKWINENRPKSYICRQLLCRPQTLEGYLNSVNIIYKGNRGEKNFKISTIRLSALEYLKTENVKSHVLRIKLIEDGIKEEKCENCNLYTWLGKKIPLELHHEDGNRFNNELVNLQILCCNCHANTENYGSKNKIKVNNNKKRIRKYNKIQKIEKNKNFVCIVCNKKVSGENKKCKSCASKRIEKRKIKDRPIYEELINDLKNTNYSAIGRKYGVSDNTIRKWIKSYELEIKNAPVVER